MYSKCTSRRVHLLYMTDGAFYSPSGLVTRIWDLSGWPDAPVAVQGPTQWYLPDGRSLWDAALDILNEGDEPDGN